MCADHGAWVQHVHERTVPGGLLRTCCPATGTLLLNVQLGRFPAHVFVRLGKKRSIRHLAHVIDSRVLGQSRVMGGGQDGGALVSLLGEFRE